MASHQPQHLPQFEIQPLWIAFSYVNLFILFNLKLALLFNNLKYYFERNAKT